MDSKLIIVFIIFFVILGAGGTLFWKSKHYSITDASKMQSEITMEESDEHLYSQIDMQQVQQDQDAIYSPWVSGKCKTLSGTCGIGVLKSTRTCLKDGTGDGVKCKDLPLSKEEDCYIHCTRPSGIVDWGHSNDYSGLPVGSPMKGWYDISGQGQPNDFCRWVGDRDEMFWACHNEDHPYIKADPSHISFSGGPSNKSIPYHPTLVRKLCPTHRMYLTASDVDLQKSIANGMFSRCGARCVYDIRNPKNGWWFNGVRWVRIENMKDHPCGTTFKDEMENAKKKYDKIYDVKNAWN